MLKLERGFLGGITADCRSEVEAKDVVPQVSLGLDGLHSASQVHLPITHSWSHRPE
jgi:hypothetical protein